jgi:hypothetical protein
MPHALTVPVIAAASLVGATALGVGLGRSAIAEINPVHFQDSQETQFYSDLAPNRRADWASVTAAEYRQEASVPAPAATPSMTWPAAPPAAHDRRIDRALDSAWREARAPAPDPRYVETVVYDYDPPPRPDPVPERVRRYSSYPVTRDAPPPPPPPRRWQEPADEGDAATQ